MFKHFLTICLILSTLSFSSVWALGEHSGSAAGNEQAVVDLQANTGDYPSDSDNHPDDDHCCHAASHLLGLLSDTSADVLNTSAKLTPVYQFSLFSRSSSPPYRPPLS